MPVRWTRRLLLAALVLLWKACVICPFQLSVPNRVLSLSSPSPSRRLGSLSVPLRPNRPLLSTMSPSRPGVVGLPDDSYSNDDGRLDPSFPLAVGGLTEERRRWLAEASVPRRRSRSPSDGDDGLRYFPWEGITSGRRLQPSPFQSSSSSSSYRSMDQTSDAYMRWSTKPRWRWHVVTSRRNRSLAKSNVMNRKPKSVVRAELEAFADKVARREYFASRIRRPGSIAVEAEIDRRLAERASAKRTTAPALVQRQAKDDEVPVYVTPTYRALARNLVGQRVTATCITVTKFGAYFDGGFGVDGLLHVKDMKTSKVPGSEDEDEDDGFIVSPTDVVKPGEVHDLWIKYVDDGSLPDDDDDDSDTANAAESVADDKMRGGGNPKKQDDDIDKDFWIKFAADAAAAAATSTDKPTKSGASQLQLRAPPPTKVHPITRETHHPVTGKKKILAFSMYPVGPSSSGSTNLHLLNSLMSSLSPSGSMPSPSPLRSSIGGRASPVPFQIPVSALSIDSELWGVVTRVTAYGAYLDCGLELEPFLHFMDHPDLSILLKLRHRELGTGGRGRIVRPRAGYGSWGGGPRTIWSKNEGNELGKVKPKEFIEVGDRVRVWVKSIDRRDPNEGAGDLKTISLQKVKKRVSVSGLRPSTLPMGSIIVDSDDD